MKETPQQYAQRVAGYLEGRDAMEVLGATPGVLQALLEGADKARLLRQPANDGWSPGMVLAHLADSEIVYAFRLRQILASSGTPIQGIDQDAWARSLDYASEDPAHSLEDFRVNRTRTVRMLQGLAAGQWECFGVHSERGRETVRRVVELLAGHDLAHLRQLRALLAG